MKSVRLLEYGGQLVFNDVPTPTIARNEILVKIKSTAVNHLDLVKAAGTARQILPIDLPWIPGHEFSGLVEQIGGDVAGYAPGDAVFGANGVGGAYAEYLAVKPAVIARKPSNLSFEEAASVPVASQTAWQGIFTHGHLEKGQTILIHGGAGAVGAYAVQLASHAGATVIATASGDDEAYLNSLGATHVIDYRKAQFEKVLREKVDVVFDLIGGDTQKRSFLVLKAGGHLVSATPARIPRRDSDARCVGRDDEARAVRGHARQNREIAGRGNDKTRRRDRVRAKRCDPSLEGHRLEPARGSWSIAQWARTGKRQVTRQDRASCGLGLQGLCDGRNFEEAAAILWRNAMSNSISTLLTRNLHDVFGENDPERRRAATDEIFTEDCVFYEPKGVYRGRDEIDRIAGVIKATHPDFEYQPRFPPEELGDAGRIRWVSGTPGKPAAYAGTDFIVARNGRIASVYLFFDNLP